MPDRNDTITEDYRSAKLTQAEAATHLGISVRTLQRYRKEKTGPSYSRLGPARIRYSYPDLAAWLLSQRVVHQ